MAAKFNLNVAFTEPVNSSGVEPVLSFNEVWQGIKHGAFFPHHMAPYIADTEILSGDKVQFRRKLTVADQGAVHTAGGGLIVQDVILREKLCVEATTTDSGAKTTFAVSQGASSGDSSVPQLYFTGMYELWVEGVDPASEKADEMRVEYTQLARGACQDGVKTFRRWKTEGLLDKWAAEDAGDKEAPK